LTSKQRVRASIAHQQPDRVAIDYYARGEITQRLCEHLGISDGESLEQKIGVDVTCVHPIFKSLLTPRCYADPTVEITPDGLHRDIWGVGFRANQTEVGFYMDLADYPLRDLGSVAELDDYPWPTADSWDYSQVRAEAEGKSHLWVYIHSRGIFEISWFLRGFDNLLSDMAAAPERANAVMDRVQEYLMERTRRVLEAGQGAIDMVEYNDDVAAQNGLLLSPRMWREFLKPRIAAFIRMCKPYDVKIKYHCCGGLRPIIPDLIDLGVDVLNPVQVLAAGMEPAALKREFGERLTFNGGVDTQQLLPNASRDEVVARTRWLLDTLGAGGGYILGPSHAFQADVPLENVLAVYETALGRKL